MAMAGSEEAKPCKKCKAEDAPLQLRKAPTCRNCYIQILHTKVVKRLGTLQAEIRTLPTPEPRRYTAGLSFGPSSSTLIHMLSEQAQYHANKKGSTPLEVLAVHVDTELDPRQFALDDDTKPANRLLNQYREKFPLVDFQCVHISKVLELNTVDWSALPGLGDPEDPPCDRLRRMFESLPSVTARSDILRLLVKHLLLHVAMENSYRALLLGHSTTALASLTLSEVANGRGFSVPWQINDGYTTICTYSEGTDAKAASHSKFPVYYPLRELMKGEINTYISLVPALLDLDVGSQALEGGGGNNVVSHKDTSIDEVMTRYFDSVEDSYAGIVTNVVRTTGKLDRARGDTLCGLCGITLDEQGDSRWAGEIGDETGNGNARSHMGKLCYGCQRSVNG